MNPATSSPLADSSLNIGVVLCLGCVLLVPFAIAGLALMYAGLGRSRNAAHQLLTALCGFSVAALAYFVCGFAFQGAPGLSSYWFEAGGRSWSWIAAGRFFLRGVAFDGSLRSVTPLFQLFCVGLAAIIPAGACGGRWKISASALSAALLAGWIYPLFAHWVWGGGWLAQLGANFSLGNGFVDAGGSTVISGVGGVTGLCAAWILGPRRGKYSADGAPAAIPGHDILMVGLGCLLTMVGWLGLNSAGALLFAAAAPGAVITVGVNTVLSAAGATLAAVCLTALRFGKPDASLCMNGLVGGLVASSAGCVVLSPLAAILTGLIAGALVTYSVEILEVRLQVDDPGGVISMHLVCGVWGAVAVAIFSFTAASPAAGQWLAQLAGIATLLGLVLPLSYVIHWAIDRARPMRVRPEAERQGLDIHELGAGAYPEFITHGDDLLAG